VRVRGRLATRTREYPGYLRGAKYNRKRNSIIIKGSTVRSFLVTIKIIPAHDFEHAWPLIGKEFPKQLILTHIPERELISLIEGTPAVITQQGNVVRSGLILFQKYDFKYIPRLEGFKLCFEVAICCPVFQIPFGRLRYPGYLLCLVARSMTLRLAGGNPVAFYVQ
jgi:hypothetical protein